ncbi:MAG: hypothetical protein J3Q66DRAFT_406161 [Benniella sp.]|nr:MAG: hypothetical protein J3Q66DRAFT_406161 [Benniella sp.]
MADVSAVPEKAAAQVGVKDEAPSSPPSTIATDLTLESAEEVMVDNQSKNVQDDQKVVEGVEGEETTKEKMYPVGKGIVYTKTSFFVDEQGKEKKNDKVEGEETQTQDQGIQPQEQEQRQQQEQLQEQQVQGKESNLGIGIGVGGGDGGKSKHKGKSKGKSKDATTQDRELSWDELVLYGDDGYEKRPVPKGCDELGFEDQMIWDQQGNKGEIINYSVSKVQDDQQQQEEGELVDGKELTIGTPSSAGMQSLKTAPLLRQRMIVATLVDAKVEDKGAVPPPAEANSPITAPETKKDSTIDVKEKKDDKKVSPDGISICLLGPCDDDDKDKDKDGEGSDGSQQRRHQKVHHKQKRFLKKFRGMALLIDGKTGCPVRTTIVTTA